MGKKARGLLSAVKKVFRHSTKVQTSNKKEKDNWKNEEPLPTEISLESVINEHSEDNRHVAVNLTEYSKEQHAAVAIQSYYRGYLARRALRALKSLVKLQALVRGYNVRRQAQMTMRCMQSLVRVQERVKARRLQLTEERRRSPGPSHRLRQQCCAIPEDAEDRSVQGWSWFEKWRSTQPPPHYARLALDDASEIDAGTPRTGRMMSPARSMLSKNGSVPGYMAPTESAKAKVRERGYSGNYNDYSSSGGNMVEYHCTRTPTWRSNQGTNGLARKACPGNEPNSFCREMEAV